MACTLNRDDPLGGLPPKHCLNGGYKPVFTNRLQLEEALSFCKTTLENNLKENVNLVRVSAPGVPKVLREVACGRVDSQNDELCMQLQQWWWPGRSGRAVVAGSTSSGNRFSKGWTLLGTASSAVDWFSGWLKTEDFFAFVQVQ